MIDRPETGSGRHTRVQVAAGARWGANFIRIVPWGAPMDHFIRSAGTDNDALPDLFTVLTGGTSTDDTEPGKHLTPAERFEAFDDANPHINQLLVNLAREWMRRTGRNRLGIAALWERMRWELSIQTNETPVLNNDYRAFYARKLMADHADLADLFEVRRSAADEWIGRAAA